MFFYSFAFLSLFFFFSSRRRHTRSLCDWSSDVCSSDLPPQEDMVVRVGKALKASWDRSVDETKHGRVLKFASLDEAVVALSKEGFEIVFKDAVACQMRQAKRANGLAVVGLAILTGGLSLIPDVLQRGGKKDNMILLRLDAEGRVRFVKTKNRYVPPLEIGSYR